MKRALLSLVCLAPAACGGGAALPAGDAAPMDAAPDGASSDAGGGITPAQRAAAAQATATSGACAAITPFYWEIGDATGLLASGTGGDGSAAPPTASAPLLIASASKWLFSTWVVERAASAPSDAEIKALNFHSGYTNFKSCGLLSTVASCLTEAGANGGTNGDHVDATDGKFFYSGGHMQALASTEGLGLDHDAKLATDLQSVLGAEVGISYVEPQLAGGGRAAPSAYAAFLRDLVGGRYAHMRAALGTHAVCTRPGADCPDALFSPVNQSRPPVPPATTPNDISDERWHYSLGHWVEDDPDVGDGAFSSPGLFGFYPWVDASKTYYGLVARYDLADVAPADPKQASYITSAFCGRAIRKAWLTGAAP